MTPDEFRKLGHALVEWIAEYRENVAAMPVMATVQPGEVRARLPRVPPETGESLDGLIEDLERIVMPGITHWNHPRFFAYFPSNSDLSSVLADIVATGLGVQGMSWQTSPAATELEEVVVDWLRQMVGLPDEFAGVIHDTASTATLTALLEARERSTALGQFRGGLQAEAKPLTVYYSEQAHSSVDKGALLAGFGAENLRPIDTDERYALRPELLRKAIADDLESGRVPSAVVASVGTTATTAIDPVHQIAEIAREFGIWLHVDAALAGAAMILPECRHLWDGVELADSVVFNAHKWLGVAFDCSIYLVREPGHLVSVMSTSPSYLLTAVDASVRNYRDWHIQLGRRFRALKIWLLVRDQGVEGLRARLRRDLEHARWFEAEVRRAEGWEVIAPVALQTICVRHVPDEVTSDDAINAHNLAWANLVNSSGLAYLTPAIVNGRQIVRVSIGALTTERSDMESLWNAMRDAVRRPSRADD
jgi:aromatic-L-amino-acid/L-tryptophan decarboxylase